SGVLHAKRSFPLGDSARGRTCSVSNSVKFPPAGTFLSSAVDSESTVPTVPLHPPTASISDRGNNLRSSIASSSALSWTTLTVFSTLQPARCRREAVRSGGWLSFFSTEENCVRRQKSHAERNPPRRARILRVALFVRDMWGRHAPTCVFTVGDTKNSLFGELSVTASRPFRWRSRPDRAARRGSFGRSFRR